MVEGTHGRRAGERQSVREALEDYGVLLKYPYCSGVEMSKHSHMRELRVQHAGRHYRVLYAFDARRTAILLIGGDKTGDERWYDTFVPVADTIYDRHIAQLQREGELNDGPQV